MVWGDEVETMIGKVFTSVSRNGNDEIIFENAKEQYKLYHAQDCCESVFIDSVYGDLSDLENTPIILADESYIQDRPAGDQEYEPESYTWSFYRFGTEKGYVDIKFYGTSNGYYNETARLEKREKQ